MVDSSGPTHRPSVPDSEAPGGSAWDARDLLLEISCELASARSRDELLQIITDAALRIVPGADKCVVHLLDASGQRLIPAVCSRPWPVPVPGPGLSADAGVAGRALREARMVSVPDTAESPDFVPLSSGPELRALLVAPLQVDGRQLGTLSLSSSRPNAFCAESGDQLAILAAHASVAIEQGRLLAAVIAERELADAVIASISDGLAVLDVEGRVLQLNPALRRILRIAQAVPDLPCRVSEIPVLCGLVPERGDIVGPYEAQARLSAEEWVTVRVLVADLQHGHGERVIALRDVSDERRAAEARSLFVSQVSHELRTPLQHMLSFVSLMSDLEDLSDEERRRFLGHIEHEARRMGRLVNDLVVLSSIERGQFATWLERADICGLVESAVARLEPYAHLLELDLVLTCPQGPILVVTDPTRLEQVLVNLLDNAFKHVPSGGRIELGVSLASGNAVTIEVRDSGPGIPAEELPYLFDSFYQASSSRSRGTGMGLGLYICRQIVEALGGSIWVQSKVGEGSTFAFRLPLAPG